MDLDSMLKDLGQFGRYQLVCFITLMPPVIMCGFGGLEYVFTTMDIPHRCRVPEVEGSSGPVEFSPAWLAMAVPFTEDLEPEECLRYRPRPNATAVPLASMFDTDVLVRCSQWVFEEPTRTIIHDYNLFCPEDEWKLAAVGTNVVFTAVIGLPLAGLISDRIGRKMTLIAGAFMMASAEVVRSFINDYDTFINSQMLLGLLSGSVYGPSFLIGLEMLPPKKRLLGSMLINIYFCIGEVVLGLAMWWLQDWRLLLRDFYLPMILLMPFYVWFIPESVRWLYAKRRYDDVEKVLIVIAKSNGTSVKLPAILEHLRAHATSKGVINDRGSTSPEEENRPTSNHQLLHVFMSKVLMLRLAAFCICWMAMLFSYYGLTIDSVSVAGNPYVNFLLVSVVEVPAYAISLWVPDMRVLGRRWTTAISFLLTTAACWTFVLIGRDNQGWLNLLLLVGKFCSTLTLTVVYIYTAEVFPTELRSSMLSFCSTLGRLGHMFVPQIPRLANFIDPMWVFGGVSLVGAALSLTFPETLHTKLPDTIKEAEDIGKVT